MPDTILYDSLTSFLGFDASSAFKTIPHDSHCGKACEEIISKGRELKGMIDPMAYSKLRGAIRIACEVVCFG